MGKRIEKAFVLTIVLSLQLLLSANNASAGFFDWMVSKEYSPILVQSSSQDRLAQGENFWEYVKSKTEDSEPQFTVIKTHEVRATGYSSTPDQTDDTPFITASGTYVRDGIIAANFHLNGKRVPFGTKVMIPEIYGEKIFIVEDRMNSRYTNNIDIWFPERSLARSFGSKNVVIHIVEES